MFFVGESLWAKSTKKLFGQVWGNSGKNPSHLQKFACSYTYVFLHRRYDKSRNQQELV